MSYSINKTPAYVGSADTNKVLRQTYTLLAMTLLVSAIGSALTMAMGLGGVSALILALIGFALVFVVMKTAESASGIGWLFLFTAVMGGSMGPMLNSYLSLPGGGMIVMQALGSTALIFFALSAYTLTTKKDFSYMGGFLMVGLVLAVIASLANIFFAVPAMSLAISSIVALLMAGFILYDTSQIVNGGETNYIRATLSMYLNVFNLFSSLLRIFGFLGGSDD